MQSHIADLYDTRGSICVAHERLSICCATAAGEGKDDCYPARVHATLDLLDRHLATMKDQLTPKPLVGRAPPKKVVSARHLYSVVARLFAYGCWYDSTKIAQARTGCRWQTASAQLSST